MTPEAQKIAIEEACPDRIRFYVDEHQEKYPTESGGWWQWRTHCNQEWTDCYLNDPLSDLNAIHEVEKVLKNVEDGYACGRYTDNLGKGYGLSRFGKIHATAAQRAEAFLRTLGKWTE